MELLLFLKSRLNQKYPSSQHKNNDKCLSKWQVFIYFCPVVTQECDGSYCREWRSASKDWSSRRTLYRVSTDAAKGTVPLGTVVSCI